MKICKICDIKFKAIGNTKTCSIDELIIYIENQSKGKK